MASRQQRYGGVAKGLAGASSIYLKEVLKRREQREKLGLYTALELLKQKAGTGLSNKDIASLSVQVASDLDKIRGSDMGQKDKDARIAEYLAGLPPQLSLALGIKKTGAGTGKKDEGFGGFLSRTAKGLLTGETRIPLLPTMAGPSLIQRGFVGPKKERSPFLDRSPAALGRVPTSPGTIKGEEDSDPVATQEFLDALADDKYADPDSFETFLQDLIQYESQMGDVDDVVFENAVREKYGDSAYERILELIQSGQFGREIGPE